VPPRPPEVPAFITRRLAAIEEAGRFRSPPTIEDAVGVRARVWGREVLLFCSNDYLGLRGDPRLAEAGHTAAQTWGAGAGSSRLIAGSLPVHYELEDALADWMGTEAALVCSSGYQANLALLQGVSRAGDRILSDSLNHASIIDGCRLSPADVSVVPHGSPAALRSRLSSGESVAGETFVVLEGLYSMDGDRGQLAEWAAASGEVAAHMLVDEAHALGVLGPEGRGASAEAGVDGRCLARMGTFGKALGSHGAFVACSAALRDLLVNSGRTYIFTTGLPPSSAGAALAALQIVRSDEGAALRGRLAELSVRLRGGLQQLGLDVLGDSDSPIVPVVVGSERAAMDRYASLLGRGIYAMAIRPPTVAPGTCRLRFTLSAAHSETDVDCALAAMAAVLAED
jgi:8-amino-7-oxononanoate synthase